MGYIYAGISVFTWGTVFVVSRFIISNNVMHPFVLAFWRFFWTSVFLLFFIKFNLKKVFKIFMNDSLIFLLLAISGIYLMSTFIFVSLETASASVSSILMNSNPIFVFLISILFLKEKISLTKLIGVIIGFIGCAIVIKGDIFIFSWNSENINLYPILSAISWAIYTVLGEKPTKKYGAIETTFIASFIGSIFLFITILILKLNLWGKEISGFLTGLYLGIVPTGIGFTLWFQSLNYLRPSSLAPFQYFVSIITVILSFLFLKEKTSYYSILGMFFIFFSIFLTQEKLTQKHKFSIIKNAK